MSERNYGILGTFIVHNIILLILLFTVFRFPLPTPSEGGILINFGDMDYAGGTAEPRLDEMPPAVSQREVQQTNLPDNESGILTQDFEETATIDKPPDTRVTENPPETRTTPAQTSVAQTPPPEPQVNERALYTSRGTTTTQPGTSEGIYQGQGNMGSTQGTPEGDNYSEGLGGSGIAFNLNGRNPLFLQKPAFNVYTEGLIVVEISVDPSGNVISATPGVRGSTIVDNVLYEAVKKAAMESKFNVRNDAPSRQIGTITYHFRLQ